MAKKKNNYVVYDKVTLKVVKTLPFFGRELNEIIKADNLAWLNRTHPKYQDLLATLDFSAVEPEPEVELQMLARVTVEKPESCDECAFHSYCGDRGDLCCGREMPTYKAPIHPGLPDTYDKPVSTPEEAMEHGTFCMFVRR